MRGPFLLRQSKEGPITTSCGWDGSQLQYSRRGPGTQLLEDTQGQGLCPVACLPVASGLATPALASECLLVGALLAPQARGWGWLCKSR